MASGRNDAGIPAEFCGRNIRAGRACKCSGGDGSADRRTADTGAGFYVSAGTTAGYADRCTGRDRTVIRKSERSWNERGDVFRKNLDNPGICRPGSALFTSFCTKKKMEKRPDAERLAEQISQAVPDSLSDDGV